MYINEQLFWNAFGAGAGGFAGVIFFFLIRYIFELLNKRPKVIKEYFIANDINIGQENENPGLIMHHNGLLIDDSKDFKKLDMNIPYGNGRELKQKMKVIRYFMGHILQI